MNFEKWQKKTNTNYTSFGTKNTQSWAGILDILSYRAFLEDTDLGMKNYEYEGAQIFSPVMDAVDRERRRYGENNSAIIR